MEANNLIYASSLRVKSWFTMRSTDLDVSLELCYDFEIPSLITNNTILAYVARNPYTCNLHNGFICYLLSVLMKTLTASSRPISWYTATAPVHGYRWVSTSPAAPSTSSGSLLMISSATWSSAAGRTTAARLTSSPRVIRWTLAHTRSLESGYSSVSPSTDVPARKCWKIYQLQRNMTCTILSSNIAQ